MLAPVKASSIWCCNGKGTAGRWREAILIFCLTPHLGSFETKSGVLGPILGSPVPEKTDVILEQKAEMAEIKVLEGLGQKREKQLRHQLRII